MRSVEALVKEYRQRDPEELVLFLRELMQEYLRERDTPLLYRTLTALGIVMNVPFPKKDPTFEQVFFFLVELGYPFPPLPSPQEIARVHREGVLH